MRNPFRWPSRQIPTVERANTPPPPSSFDSWFNGKEFSEDWTSWHFSTWAEVLAGLQCRRILEIGSFEGRSALWFLNYFPTASLTCVDIFNSGHEGRFDRNTAAFGARLNKVKGPSTVKLPELIAAGDTYDLVYVDGWHHRDQCLIDGLLAWRMLPTGGILIFDDYLWGAKEGVPIQKRPQDGIDIFVHLYRSELAVLHVGWQVIARRVEAEHR